MPQRPDRSAVLLWACIGILGFGLVLAIGAPMRGVWQCLSRFNDGEHAQARVMSMVEDGSAGMLLLGPEPVRTCVVGPSDLPAGLEIGDEIAVVVRSDLGEWCTTADTLAAANALFTALGAVVVATLLALVLVGRSVQRMLTKVPTLTTRFEDLAPGASTKACPSCEKPMVEGYLPLVGGIHWRDAGTPIGWAHALGGMPGTAGWRGRPRLHAMRCDACEIVLFRYGSRQQASL